MKIALAQLNYHIANFESNSFKIIEKIKQAERQTADLVVFSEMSVCGYPPRDMLEIRDFIAQVEQTVLEIAKHCQNIAAVVGAPVINPDPKGKMLYNSALMLYKGKIYAEVYKSLLPTYDVFDEYRYFEPNTEFKIIDFKGQRLALTICEDLWDDQPVENSFAKNKLYRTSPMRRLIDQQPDIIINIAASPFSYTQDNVRRSVLRQNATQYNLPLVYVNQVGAQTELIFDGGSMFLNQQGEIVEELAYFEEDFKIVDTQNYKQIRPTDVPRSPSVIEKIHHAIVLGIRDYFHKSGLKKATLGLSGGIDSAVTCVLAARALGPENMRVLLLPSKFSSKHSLTDAKQLAENLNMAYDIVPIQNIVDQFEKNLQPIFGNLPRNVAEENIQARTRAIILMGLSNKHGYLLLNTSNKSEAAVGYGTLYGDMCGALSILGDVYKKDVYNLANYINKDKEIIPSNTINKPPSAELAPDQKDTDSLPEYAILDDLLYQYIELKKREDEIIAQGYDRALVQKVISLVNRNEFKRFQTPPILRVSTKAFGMGRRMPLVGKF